MTETKGFTLHINNTDYLFVTDKKTKTKGLIQKAKQTLERDGNLTPTIAFSIRSKLEQVCLTDTSKYVVVNVD